MIGYLQGRLLKKEDEKILLLVGGVGYNILLPASVMASITASEPGDELSFSIYYHQTERQPKPTLIGFHTEEEKEFFQLFISVEDIGPMKAVKAMGLPIEEISAAIEGSDLKSLMKLPGIGKRTAQKIIATLEGKTARFALEAVSPTGTPAPPQAAFVDQVIDVLTHQLGHKSSDARTLVADAMARNPAVDSPEALLDEVYRAPKG
ncbi:Holliday junction branch migration protein RuvA [Desulfoluna spongiiphila]|uniref:Holliday junction branch migration protein RuvA n=1 Tax=Desulfoluna spongiiphila TaxID=419481 RepID=UPI0012545CA9|nr:Holliday junction branch migration protein RuvA [Desulfoluna spongiiphila]VVS92099.1 bacterial dna recombination protein ruva [Desulfoluna spongiiphila]